MKTVLLVDDDYDNLRCFGEILNGFGFKTIAMPDAETALTIIQEGASIDLVITDYRMPGMDGMEFIALLKQILPTVPVILLTAYGVMETYLKSLRLGVFEYVSKPIKARELIRIVQAGIERSENINAVNKVKAKSLAGANVEGEITLKSRLRGH